MYIPNTHYKKHEKTSKNPLPVCIVKKLKLKNISWKFFLVGQGRNWKEIIKFKIKGKRFLIEKSLQMLIFCLTIQCTFLLKVLLLVFFITALFVCLYVYFPKQHTKNMKKTLLIKANMLKLPFSFSSDIKERYNTNQKFTKHKLKKNKI